MRVNANRISQLMKSVPKQAVAILHNLYTAKELPTPVYIPIYIKIPFIEALSLLDTNENSLVWRTSFFENLQDS